MLCPNCNRTNHKTADFCEGCGQILSEKKEKNNDLWFFEAERKYVTVLFSDLTGYSKLFEHLDPEEVEELTSRIFSEISEVIAKGGNPLLGIEYSEKCFYVTEKIQDFEIMAKVARGLCGAYIVVGEPLKSANLAAKVTDILGNTNSRYEFTGPESGVVPVLYALHGHSLGWLGNFEMTELAIKTREVTRTYLVSGGAFLSRRRLKEIDGVSFLDGLLAERGQPGFNVKVLTEMGEEQGPPELYEICGREKDPLQADVLIASDGPRIDPGKPTIAHHFFNHPQFPSTPRSQTRISCDQFNLDTH
jgi:hypothetical protein